MSASHHAQKRRESGTPEYRSLNRKRNMENNQVRRKSALRVFPHHLRGVFIATSVNEFQLQRSGFLGPTHALKKARVSLTGASE